MPDLIAGFRDAATNEAIDWNWEDSFVQADTGSATSGRFLGGYSTLVCVGPPVASSTFSVLKLGMSPSVSFSQQPAMQPLYEIGSKRVHYVMGVPSGGGSIQRFLYNGDTLMKAAYKAVFDDGGRLRDEALAGMNLLDRKSDADAWARMVQNTGRISRTHESGKLWLSMWDNKLKFPIGLACYFQDSTGDFVGGLYLEGVKFSSHNMSVQSSQMVLAESMNFVFDRMVPIAGSISGIKKAT